MEKENCSICIQEIKEPKELYCGHIFCKGCIHQVYVTAGKYKRRCPLCRSYLSSEEFAEFSKFVRNGPSSPLFCGICSNLYKIPRVLRCNHKFCRSCLNRRFRKCMSDCPTCPTCYSYISYEDITWGDPRARPRSPFCGVARACCVM